MNEEDYELRLAAERKAATTEQQAYRAYWAWVTESGEMINDPDACLVAERPTADDQQSEGS
jgi:hypothetical protein